MVPQARHRQITCRWVGMRPLQGVCRRFVKQHRVNLGVAKCVRVGTPGRERRTPGEGVSRVSLLNYKQPL